MTSTDKPDSENFQDVVDRDADGELEREKSKGPKSSSKSKDLSHVPCKFFKVGSCTAGASCPFSHTSQEPGQHKDVCAWFVKGNCKFGHKCALAHILPGQSMAMDRKNKKSAQLAANGGNSGGNNQSREGGKAGKGGKRDGHGHSGLSAAAPTSNNPARNTLLSGSTAPTRMLPNSARPPMSMLKATMSPSAPAPPLKDTDFASFGLPDESNKLPSAPAQRKMSTSNTSPEGPAQPDAQSGDEKSGDPSKAPALALPVSTPSAPQRLGLSHRSSHSHDFGPIGSPPRSLSSQTIHLNGYSPGSSPAVPISSSPFSAPGSQSVFEPGSLLDFKARSGLAASLGATRTWKTDLGPVPSQVKNRGEGIGAIRGLEREILAEDEDLEEFLPSSLTDLLTPEERSRRMSRTGSAHPGNLNNATLTPRSIAEGPHHRYSRSVPAPSLLGDIKSIWADQNGLPGSPDTGAGLGNVGLGGGLGGGTPNSFKSNSGFGGRSFGFEDTPSPSLLSPSNASAAFLPGLHHHYLNSKMGPQRSTSGGNRTGGPALYPPNSGVATPQNTSTSNLTSSNPAGAAFQQSKVGSLGNRAPYDNFTSDSYSSPLGLHRQISGRPIPGGSGVFGAEGDERHSTISPSTRALQAHAPGQSLPQGLAAGYSRIHALPPPMIASPSAFGSSQNSAYSPGTNPDWTSVSTEQLSTSQNNGTPMTTSANGLETMFSRLSYSAAASRTTTQGMSTTAGLPQSPPKSSPLGMSRGNNRNWQGQGPLSPLSGPVVTGDDDDLFSMDG